MLEASEIAAIVGMYFVDHLTVNQISKQTGRHHSAINRVLRAHENGDSQAKIASPRPQVGSVLRLTPYREYIAELLDEHAGITVTRIREKLADREVAVSIDQLRRFIRREGLKARKARAFMKVKTGPGEQAQVDWAHCGKIPVQGGFRQVSLFVATLGYSRKIFARFYVDQSMASFLSAHLHAFAALGGVPETMLYDNLKSAVLSRLGRVIQFNPNLLRFASQYHFKVDACNPRSGWEKGKVERSIRYIRDSFLAARPLEDLDRMNAEIALWLKDKANQRPWPQDKQRLVDQVWDEDERKILRPLKEQGPKVEVRVPARVGKTPYFSFDLNRYSVPAEHVQKDLMLWVSEDRVRAFHDNTEIASHRRSYARGLDVEDPEHIAQMLRDRQAARDQVRRRLIYQHVGNAGVFFERLRDLGANLSVAYKRVYDLSSRHPLSKIDEKMAELLAKDLVSTAGLAQLLENSASVPCTLDLSRYPALDGQAVYRRDLADYQKLSNHRRSEPHD